MNLKLDNFRTFHGFEMSMTYPKKIVKSIIPNEHLKGRPNFRYKKLNIIMGSNASGKTSLSSVILGLVNFMAKKEGVHIIKMVNNRNKDAIIEMDFVVEDILYRININILAEQKQISPIEVCIRKVKINKNDSYETCSCKLNQMEIIYNEKYNEELEKLDEHLEWFFIFASSGIKTNVRNPNETYRTILEKILKTLDPSIISVSRLAQVENSFVVKIPDNEIIIQEGNILDHKLSSGTIKGIKIANIVYSILNEQYKFYYCDEMFSYIHTDVERAILALIVDALGENSQLFFTTHNWDILDLGYPKHSYGFLKKEKHAEQYRTVYTNASQYLQRNTDSLRCAIENDLFGVAPDLSLLDEML